jgi:hypothetical protein
MAACASTNLSQMSEYDQERLTSYLNAVRTYTNWVVAQPQLADEAYEVAELRCIQPGLPVHGCLHLDHADNLACRLG